MAIDFLGAGIEAFRHHQLERAQSKFAQAVVADPNSANAWLWLGRVITNPEHRLYCYQRVLELDPRNAEAAQAFQYIPMAARTPSVQRALALAAPVPRPAIRRIAPAAALPPSKPRGVQAPGYLLLNLLLILVFLSLYIAVEWYNITTSVQNVAITPVTVITRAIAAPPTPPSRSASSLSPTNAPTTRRESSASEAADMIFAQAQKDLDTKNYPKVIDILLFNLPRFSEKRDLADAYYYLGRAELGRENYRAAAGYFKQLYALEPSVEYLFMLAVAYDMAGDPKAALEQYTALAAWSGKDAPIYRGLAERRIADIKQFLAATPTVTR